MPEVIASQRPNQLHPPSRLREGREERAGRAHMNSKPFTRRESTETLLRLSPLEQHL